MPLRQERWSAARRSAEERKLLFNPLRLRQDATSRFHLAVAIYDPAHSADSDRDEIRSSTLFVDLFPSERQRTPRGSIGKSSRTPPPASTYPRFRPIASGKKFVSSGTWCNVGVSARVIAILQCRFLLFEEIRRLPSDFPCDRGEGCLNGITKHF